MYFQFLIEDLSTEILINHVIEKLKAKYPDREIYADTKSFKGIGHLATHGNLMERKGGNLLNNLHMYLRGFDRSLASMKQAAIIVVLDNDKRDPEVFRQELENVAKETVKLTDCVFCVAVKEMEAWLLEDENAIWEAYPSAKKKFLRDYEQDGICPNALTCPATRKPSFRSIVPDIPELSVARVTEEEPFLTMPNVPLRAPDALP